MLFTATLHKELLLFPKKDFSVFDSQLATRIINLFRHEKQRTFALLADLILTNEYFNLSFIYR